MQIENFITINKIFIRSDRLQAIEQILGHPLNTEDDLALCIGIEEAINFMVDKLSKEKNQENP